MASLDRIRKHGFCNWYQRQLIESHAWLVSWFLGVIVLVCGIELAGESAALRISGALLVLGGLAISLFSMKRYYFMFCIAERLGEQAICPGCKAYAKFSVQFSPAGPLQDGGGVSLENDGEGIRLHAQCNKCGVEWTFK